MEGIPPLGGNYLEPDYKDAYDTWQADQTPQGNAAFLSRISPIVQKGVSIYGGGNNNPNLNSQAKLLALQAARTYDPKRARLQSHLLTHLQGLQRINRQQQEVIRTPERVRLERNRLKACEREIADDMGRDPTDGEIADKLGISLARLARIRKYQPGINTGRVSTIDPDTALTSKLPGEERKPSVWLEIVYEDLEPLDQKIMEYSLGMNSHPKLSNQEIARKLNRSPGAITQRKAKIQQLLDQEQTLSPFGTR